jgi:hypothetical protein
MAGLNSIGLYLDNTISAEASGNITVNHWRVFSKPTGIFAVDSNGSEYKLNNYEDLVGYTGNMSGIQMQISDISAVNSSQQTAINQLQSITGNYTLLSTTALLTGNLQGQITSAVNINNSQQTAINQLQSITGNYALTSTVASVSGTLRTQIASTSASLYTLTANTSANILSNVDSNYVHRTNNVNESINGNKTFTNNVVVQGTFTALSGSFGVIVQEVSAYDNLIEINVGDTGPGVTRGYAGIKINRGSASPYAFLFDENRDAFVIGSTTGPVTSYGVISEMQSVATRQDSPINKGIAYWQDSGTPSGGHMFTTSSTLSYDIVGGLSANKIKYTPINPLSWSSVPSDVFSALDTLSSSISSNQSSVIGLIASTSGNLYNLTASTSANLYNLTVSTSANLRSFNDRKFVPISGGTMTGTLIISAGAYISSPKGVASNNEAFGALSLYSLNSIMGGDNTALGNSALYTLTSGESNTAVGLHSAQYLTTGGYNVALGKSSLLYSISGSNNTAVGTYAYFTLRYGDNNISMGREAGCLIGGSLFTLNNSTFLGTHTKTAIDGVSNSTAIGYGAVVDASNQIVLGNASVLNVMTSGAITTKYLAGVNGNIVTHDQNGKLIDSGILATSLATSSYVSSVSASLVAYTVTASANSYAFTVAASANAYANTAATSAAIANNIVNMMEGGTINCNTTSYSYAVTHKTLFNVGHAFPITSLVVPTSSSILYIQSITNRTTSGFNVILSDVPDTTGYQINWVLFKPYFTAIP